MEKLLISFACALTFPVFAGKAVPNNGGPHWAPWSDGIFAEAKREKRFVLLDLEAVWCHWCHVMDETTYKDPATLALLKSKYITVRVGQDSRPELSNRYEDYGWPATVVFNADGQEIARATTRNMEAGASIRSFSIGTESSMQSRLLAREMRGPSTWPVKRSIRSSI